MKSLRFRFLIAALAVLIGTTTFTKAQSTDDTTPPPPPMHHHGMGGPDMMMGFWSKKLNLTDDQKTQMKAVWEKEKPTMKPLHQQERQIDEQLKQYVEGNFDQAKVQALAAQKAQIQTQLTVEETKLHNQMYQLLTSDQKAQLKQMQAEHQARMQQRMNQAPPAAPEQ